MTATQTVTRTELDPVTGEPFASHIIRRKPGEPRTAIALVMEARVEGTEVEALCGKRWVPQRDPKQYPLCSACEAVMRDQTPANPGGLPS